MKIIHHCYRILMIMVVDGVRIRYRYHDFHVLGNLSRYLFFSRCCMSCLRIIYWRIFVGVDCWCWCWLVIGVIVNIGVNSNYISQC